MNTQINCVPFKFSFGDDETVYGQVVVDGANIDLNLMTSHKATIGTIKFSDLDIVLTPAVLNTIYMSYFACLGEDEEPTSTENDFLPTLFVFFHAI